MDKVLVRYLDLDPAEIISKFCGQNIGTYRRLYEQQTEAGDGQFIHKRYPICPLCFFIFSSMCRPVVNIAQLVENMT